MVFDEARSYRECHVGIAVVALYPTRCAVSATDARQQDATRANSIVRDGIPGPSQRQHFVRKVAKTSRAAACLLERVPIISQSTRNERHFMEKKYIRTGADYSRVPEKFLSNFRTTRTVCLVRITRHTRRATAHLTRRRSTPMARCATRGHNALFLNIWGCHTQNVKESRNETRLFSPGRRGAWRYGDDR